MNNAQVIGMRQMHEATMTADTKQTMTARDMALSPHNLSRSGDIARLADGRVFAWVDDRELWVRTK